jgi:hypothetical protein
MATEYEEATRVWAEAQSVCIEACRAWAEACRAWGEARRAWNEARRAYEETRGAGSRFIGCCDHCKTNAEPADCGAAEIAATYVDSAGECDGRVVAICRECLGAGSETGPGYRAV